MIRYAMIWTLATTVFGCGGGGPGQMHQSYDDVVPVTHRTTSADVALSNLNGTVDGVRARLATHPSAALRTQLVDVLLTRSQYFGYAADFEEMEAVAEEAVRATPGPDAWRLRARVHTALHRFEQARADLDRAAADGADVGEDVAGLDLALGERLEEVAVVRQARADAHVTYASMLELGAVEAALGKWRLAEDSYVRAIEAYADVSPFAVAWIDFQRGVLWAEKAGVDGVAPALYRAAVKRLPFYVVANVHLAELEPDEQAIARLRRVADEAGDPEPFAVLAARLEPHDAVAAQEAAQAAHRLYDDRLTRWPLAYADHATEFYLDAGDDPARALELATLNLNNRRTDRAYDLAIRAAVANERFDLACDWVAQAGDDRPLVPLAHTRAEVSPNCR